MAFAVAAMPAEVAMTMVLGIAAVALGRISMFSGVKVQADWSGRPEQERVTNMGAVSDAAFTGMIEAVVVPDWPAVSVTAAGAMDTVKSGVVLTMARTGETCETEVMWVASPV